MGSSTTHVSSWQASCWLPLHVPGLEASPGSLRLMIYNPGLPYKDPKLRELWYNPEYIWVMQLRTLIWEL